MSSVRVMDEETSLAVIFGNTRRKARQVDLVTLARSIEYLVELYGSTKKVGDAVGLSAEMVRELLVPLKLVPEVQRLVSERVIDRIDVARELSKFRDPEAQIAGARLLAHLATDDLRNIRRLARTLRLSIEEAKERVLDAKPEEMHIFVLDFDKKTYRWLLDAARAEGREPPELVRQIVMDWLQERDPHLEES